MRHFLKTKMGLMVLASLALVVTACDSTDNVPALAINPDVNEDQVMQKLDDVNVADHMIFNTPVGSSDAGPAEPGMSYSMEFTINEDERVTLASMVAQTNDWFIAPRANEGLDLAALTEGQFDKDITSEFAVWDAGTEEDETFGEGPNQAPRQPEPNTGPADDNATVRLVEGELGQVEKYIQVQLTRLDSDGLYRIVISTVDDSQSPVTPGVIAIYSGDHNPIFVADSEAKLQGLEALAEDGNPDKLGEDLAANSNPVGDLEAVNIIDHLLFNTPVGANEAGPLAPGMSYSVEFKAQEGERLTLATMVAKSNDWFIAPLANEGLDVWALTSDEVTAVITEELTLWDAGTEEDQAFGQGDNQAPNQPEANTGPEDDNALVRVVDSEDAPSVADIVDVELTRIDDQGTFELIITTAQNSPTPVTPGVAVLFEGTQNPLFVKDTEIKRKGLEALAEDGNPQPLADEL